ncbi:MAG TPA: biotin--[acetyl-CoA-carboxylase] ligase [Pyrinomonadaceae bacterium]|nr:biotin--[acetyl-CoA-carboxylase] ligase [Pyrinomonadaceae bacterium]
MTFAAAILRFESIDSTNLEAMRQAKAGAPEGLCIVAAEQTAGRGRLDRKWHSPKGAGLYFSIILRPKVEMTAWPLITLMGALATTDALVAACKVKPDIKWPNDLCVEDRKLCGMLAETAETVDGPAAILGIGINLLASGLKQFGDQAISIEAINGRQPDAERISTALIAALRDRYVLLQSQAGREHLIREWCASSSYAFDRRVAVSTASGQFTGLTRGLDSDGALRVENQEGKVISVRAGDVTALRPSITLQS